MEKQQKDKIKLKIITDKNKIKQRILKKIKKSYGGNPDMILTTVHKEAVDNFEPYDKPNITYFIEKMCSIITITPLTGVDYEIIAKCTPEKQMRKNQIFIFLVKDMINKHNNTHISCFQDGPMHITFDYNFKKYHIYTNKNPRFENGLQDLLIFSQKVKDELFPYKSDFSSSQAWKSIKKTKEWEDIITRNDTIEYNKLKDRITILINALKYCIKNNIPPFPIVSKPLHKAHTSRATPYVRPSDVRPSPARSTIKQFLWSVPARR